MLVSESFTKMNKKILQEFLIWQGTLMCKQSRLRLPRNVLEQWLGSPNVAPGAGASAPPGTF